MSKTEKIFFDCDDTLVNSEIIAMKVAIDVLADAAQLQKPKLKIDRAQLIKDFAGWHFSKMIDELETRYNVTFDRDAVNTLKIHQTLDQLQHVTPIENMPEMLAQISAQWPIALVTSSEFDRVNLCLERTGLDVFFPVDHRYSGHDSLTPPAHKPKPDIYLHALKREQVEAHQVITVEDSRSGVQSAVNAGIACLGFVASRRFDTYEERLIAAKELYDLGCPLVISDARDLMEALNFMAGRTASLENMHGFYLLQNPITEQRIIVGASPTIICQ
jgi:beta-phosphoglucomutase-like phosphatase (HAD superfamily)